MEYALFNHRTPVHFLVIPDSVIITPIYVITTSISNIISFVEERQWRSIYNYLYFVVIYILLVFVSVSLYIGLYRKRRR